MLYLGGGFTTVGGLPRTNVAAVNAVTGATLPWSPVLDDLVLGLTASGSTVFAAGGFSSAGGAPHRGVAAINGATGAVAAWRPALAFGGFAIADLGVNVTGTDLSFLEQPAFLLVVTVFLVASLLLHGYASREPAASAIAGLGIGLGAVLFAGELASDGYTWWPGIVAGAAIAAFSQFAVRDTVRGARERLGDEHRGGLPIYLELVAGLAAMLAIVAPPVSIVYIVFLVRLLLARRRRAGEKYAGLRSLR